MLGMTLFKLKRLNEAQTAFEKSLSIEGKNARARHYLGVISSQMGISDRAEREFKSALAIDPAYGEADFNLAVVYATRTPPQWDLAKKHYADALKKGVKADPDMEKLLQGAK
jgi:Tfp pilus assembly protein PilF